MLGSAKSCLTAAEAFFFSKRILLKKKSFLQTGMLTL